MTESLEIITNEIDYIYNFKMVEGFKCGNISLKKLEKIKLELEIFNILINYISADTNGGLDFSFLNDLQYDQKKYGIVYNYMRNHKVGVSNV